jgi:sarcosine oxidase subunit alpha
LGADGRPAPGTEKTFACDAILVAVGLDPVDEFVHKAREFGLPVYMAGDAEEIAEASAAMFTGRIRGLEIARALGRDVGEVPPDWLHTAEILKSRPGAVVTEDVPQAETGVFPVFHCAQEIPCNPCTTVCPQGCIAIEGDGIGGIPEYGGAECAACERCVAICPALAITLLDYRADPANPIVTVPYEFPPETVREGDIVTVLDTEGVILGNVEVVKVRAPRFADRALLVAARAPRGIAKRIAGIRPSSTAEYAENAEESGVFSAPSAISAVDEIVCRCERVTAGEIRALIRAGYRDMNALKAATRAGMGACGGKTCTNLIKRLFREVGAIRESPLPEEVIEGTRRPLFVEVALGSFAGVVAGEGPIEETHTPHATDAQEGGL